MDWPIIGALALSSLLVVVLVGAGLNIFLRPHPPAIVDASGCYIDKAKRNDTILLLDATDPYSSRQKADLNQIFNRIWGTPESSETALLKPGERFWLVKLSGGQPPSIAAPMPGTPICMPPQTLAQRTEMGLDPAGFHDGGVRKMATIFHDKKLIPLLSEVLDTASTSPDSYIFEYIASALKPIDTESPHARIVLVSDLLQHAPREFPMASIMKTSGSSFVHTEYGGRVLPDLSNVQFQIYQVQRNKYPYDPNVVRSFWKAVLDAKHATVNWQEPLADDAPPPQPKRLMPQSRRSVESRSKGPRSRRQLSEGSMPETNAPTEPRSKGPPSDRRARSN